jgi:acyl carrier protein
MNGLYYSPNGIEKMMQDQVKQIVVSTLNLGGRSSELALSSPLLGAIPELDSMAVVGIITALEEHFGFSVHDDEISAENFETLGSLVAFVERKLDE